MPESVQISVVVPSHLRKLLKKIADNTDESLSSVAEFCLKRGLYAYLEDLNRAEVYASLCEKSKARDAAKKEE
jgi:hypothetical protein